LVAEPQPAPQPKPNGQRRSPRSPLSRERVLRAALDLADGGSIESLSMRKLAQELSVEAMSLYHYFASKEELLDGMLDAVFGEIELPSSGADWRSEMRRTAVSFHHVLLRHRWACTMLGSSTAISMTRLRYMNAVLGRLREAGFGAGMVDHAYHALDSHIIGFTLWVLPYLAMAEETTDIGRQFIEQLPPDEYPDLIDHIRYHLADNRPGDTSEFDFGLDLLLDGLEQLRTQQPLEPSAAAHN
jgi:AcrR family transcriptional regulator